MAIYTDKNGKSYNIPDNYEIFRGGEGRIMKLKGDKKHVAKLYLPGRNNITEPQKKHLNTLDDSIFVIPKELLYQKTNGEVSGFIMDFISPEFVPLSSFFNKSFCQKNNIDHTAKEKIINQLIHAVEIAHQNNIVIGDLNPYNVLVHQQNFQVKFIDTDSYQTPGKQHSGLLLEDIRDFLHGGLVNTNSDYFALSVLVFSLLTFVHPFKGIHKKYKKLADRMIQRLPIFANDPDLIRPKVYAALTDNFVQKQYDDLYLFGNRFPIVINKILAPTTQPVYQNITAQTGDVDAQEIMKDNMLKSVKFAETKVLAVASNYVYLFSAKQKGHLSLEAKFENTYHDFYLTDKHLLLRKENDIFIFKDNKTLLINNLHTEKETKISQYENLLVFVDRDFMTLAWIDEIVGQNIKTQKKTIFGEAFHAQEQFVQFAGGTNRIFYNSNSNLATAKANQTPRKIVQQSAVGFMQYIEKDQLKTKLFKIENLNTVFAPYEMQELQHFAFQQTDKENGFIYIPQDDQLEILRTQDFAKVAEIKANMLTNNTQIGITRAGIVAFEDNKIWLLNKK